MGIFRKHNQLEELDAAHSERTNAHLDRVEESLLLVDPRYRKFKEWGSHTLGILTLFRILSYAALGICLASDKVDHPFFSWIIAPVLVVSHIGTLFASPYYEDKRRQWLNRYWCDQVESQMDIERQPNQALQTTSVTRSGFGKVSVSDRQRRGV